MQSSNFSVVHLIYGRTQNHNGGTLKTLTVYWFSIVKRKVCRGLDTWKSRHRYILGVWVQSWVSENIPFVATWRWWNVFPSVGGSPPPLSPFFCSGKCHSHLQLCPVQSWLGKCSTSLFPACGSEPGSPATAQQLTGAGPVGWLRAHLTAEYWWYPSQYPCVPGIMFYT